LKLSAIAKTAGVTNEDKLRSAASRTHRGACRWVWRLDVESFNQLRQSGLGGQIISTPATVLAFATAASYPSARDLFGRRLGLARITGRLGSGNYLVHPADEAQQMWLRVPALLMFPCEVCRATDEQQI
jgi:hypothetical protein